MKEDFRKVKTFKKVYPQIYSYILPERYENNGWQKIGYTEREDVDERIREQTKTAEFSEKYKKLWSANDIYEPFEKGEFFDDHKFHEYLIKIEFARMKVMARNGFSLMESQKSPDSFLISLEK